MVNGQTGLCGLNVLRPVGKDSDGDTDSVTIHCLVEQAQIVWDPPGKTLHVTLQNVQVRVSTDFAGILIIVQLRGMQAKCQQNWCNSIFLGTNITNSLLRMFRVCRTHVLTRAESVCKTKKAYWLYSCRAASEHHTGRTSRSTGSRSRRRLRLHHPGYCMFHDHSTGPHLLSQDYPVRQEKPQRFQG